MQLVEPQQQAVIWLVPMIEPLPCSLTLPRSGLVALGELWRVFCAFWVRGGFKNWLEFWWFCR